MGTAVARRRATAAGESDTMIRMQEPARFILAYLVFPLWVAAGFADWACHRRTGIAFTSGLKENLLHWLMFAEIGVGLLAVAFLEIDAAVQAPKARTPPTPEPR